MTHEIYEQNIITIIITTPPHLPYHAAALI